MLVLSQTPVFMEALKEAHEPEEEDEKPEGSEDEDLKHDEMM